MDEPESAGEQRARALAVPAALALAWLLLHTGFGQFFVRTFFSMWVHELGHALTAWWCGRFAVPGPWATSVAPARSAGVVILLAAAQGFVAWRAWRAERRALAGACAAGLLAQLALTLGLHGTDADAVITFAGDGACFVLGAALMATFGVAPGHALRRGQARWGLVWIGAAAFVDVARTWWSARRDPESIAYGESSRAGLSDPTKLVDLYGWTETHMVQRYVTLGAVCALALAGAYAFGLYRARHPAG